MDRVIINMQIPAIKISTITRAIAHYMLLLTSCWVASATASPTSVTAAGTIQSILGCSGDWQPTCDITHLTKNGTEWSGSFLIPAGTYEYKIALNDSWAESYGYALSLSNASFTITAAKTVTFKYDEVTHLVTDNSQGDGGGGPAVVPEITQPTSVTIAGDLQTALGCGNNWDISCIETQLTLEDGDKIWQKTFMVPAGNWQYKAALNTSWAENYGANAKSGGANIPLVLASPRNVKFYYSHKTHWVADNVNSVIATAVGNFQAALACPGDWQPDCMKTWLQNVDGSGLYTFSTTALPVGSYEAKVALNETWDESYGDNGNNIAFSVTTENQKVFFTYDAARHKVYIGDEVIAGNVKTAKAYWLSRDTIAMALPSALAATASVKLYFSPSGSLTSSPDGIEGGDSISLTYDLTGLSDALKIKYRHLKNLAVYKISPADATKLSSILKQQIAVSATGPKGNLLEATALQFAGALDDLFAYSGELGVIYTGDAPTLKLWAPTAKSVKVHIYNDATTTTETAAVDMTADVATGVWSAVGDASWNRKYYLYEVEVFARNTGHIEHNWVTDPYSIALSTNGKRSMLVNLNDADLKPDDWSTLTKPELNAPEDIVAYELHIRDFSITDTTVPENERGTFMAFSENNSNGMKHLKSLAAAGVTHIHLLPAYDCATVNEVKSEQKIITDNLSLYAPDSESQQAAVETIRREDGFNWCYDPFHYTVPEGSYATDPEGIKRIKEFRTMVASLNKSGLRVVMDVVYNHTSAAFQNDTSVLDKVVPTYYHRLNALGDIETSTCCSNTASENTMMEKLMLDSMRIWATQYKIDGFRYDIMGHHTKDNIVKIKNELQNLTLADNGVDGSKIYFYGEGWNFGETADDSRFTQASIGNMSGTGVGTFNDRIRDLVRGGGCCDTGSQLSKNQSFVSGLYTAPNAENTAGDAAKVALLKAEDKLKIVLAGSLANFSFTDRTGATVKGSEVEGTGYTQDPSETINYIEAHDSETFFDMIQYKAPLNTSMADRVRMQNLGNSLVLLAQGIPFLHAGQDMLRSKSFDRDSYDSGDWFNALDFTYQKNGWGKGLPLADKNQATWSIMKPRLANAAFMPTPADITRAREATIELLKIRKSSKLFRLETAEQINSVVHFYNTGVSQMPGIIAMNLNDTAANIDPNAEDILIIFNANTSSKAIKLTGLKGVDFALHPIQAASTDAVVKQSAVDNATGIFTVPARTTAVFVATKKPTLVTSTEPAPRPKKGGGAMNIWWDMLLCLGIFGLCRVRREAV